MERIKPKQNAFLFLVLARNLVFTGMVQVTLESEFFQSIPLLWPSALGQRAQAAELHHELTSVGVPMKQAGPSDVKSN
jgi:hypothetical protein